MNCEFSQQLEAYHDGELPVDAHAAMQAHLLSCPACSQQLAELAAMSNLFATAPVPRLSQISQHRLHHKLTDEMDRGLVRLAWSLSAVAAGIMVVGSAWLMQLGNVPAAGPVATVQAAPPWADVHATAEAETVSREAATPVAQWYLADASSRTGELP
jgi:anti-sigma factor RsiW